MAIRKSTRVNSAKGGRPKGNGVKHSSKKVDLGQEREEITPDEDIKNIEEVEGDIREAIRLALVKNLPNIGKWLSEVGDLDPKSALTAFKDYTEFVLPKLQRTDSKADPANRVELVFENTDSFAERQKAKKDRQTKTHTNDFP